MSIQRDHARGYAGKDSLREGAARFELRIRGHERGRLFVQPPGHAVESARQSLNLVLGLRDCDPRGEVAFLDASGGGHQLCDRSHQSIRELQRSDNRQAYDKEGHDQQRAIETQLVQPRTGEKRAIPFEDLIGAIDLLLKLRLENSGRV